METVLKAGVDTSRYPQWVQDIVEDSHESAKAVAHHDAWYRFRDGTIPQAQHHALLIGF